MAAANNILKIKTKRYPKYLPDKNDAGRIYRIDKAKKSKKKKKRTA